MDISLQFPDGVPLIAVSGRIGAASSTRLAAVLTEGLHSGAARILVSLAAVDYISSAGLLVLQQVARQARAQGTTVVLTGLSDPVRLALEFAGMAGEFVVEK